MAADIYVAILRTCVPSASIYIARSSMESFQNSPTANINVLSVSLRTVLIKFAMKFLSMCCPHRIDEISTSNCGL